MWRIILYFIFLNNVFAKEEDKTRIVLLEQGGVEGKKYWDGDFYEFYSIPYAEAPTGRDRYQAPLPVKPWKGVISADSRSVVCHQSYYTEREDENEEFIVSGEDDCLVANVFVPEIASKDNLVPVVVYIHSGAFAGGNGNMARFHYLARHDIIVISFNYRLGALGFACLGNKEIPGNAALKDQVAALKWIKKNIIQFGGDPNKITLAGYSVGASMAELLTLSKTTEGLVDQLILDSASALSPFAINRNPIETAKNIALAMGYNGTESLDELTEFYLNASVEIMAAKSINFFLPNSTFGFAPCIENVHKGIEPFLTESPIDLLRKGQNSNIPLLIGFSNMEGISRTIKFGDWREQMTEDFTNFLPADLVFETDEIKKSVIAEIKKHYFNGEEVNHEKLQNYIDYFSDSMFKYSIIKSLKLRAAASKRKIYLYEFNYVGKLNMQHNYMDKIKGASHRDQTAYILDFFGWTNSYKDLDMRDRMTIMWSDFVKYGDPTEYESAVVNFKWVTYTNENQNYLQLTRKPTMKKNLFADGYNFWNKFYEQYYWNPTAPTQPKPQNIKKKHPEVEQLNKTDKSNDIKNVNDMKNEPQKDKLTKDSKVVFEEKDESKVFIIDTTEEEPKKEAQPQKIMTENNKSVKENKRESGKETVKENKIGKDAKEGDKKVNKEKKVVDKINKESDKDILQENNVERDAKEENNKVNKEEKIVKKSKNDSSKEKKETLKVVNNVK